MIDPVGSIRKLYDAGARSVPYPLFMSCFNRLLDDPTTVVPAEPTEDLREYLRGVCMGLELGVSDPQGRDEDRRREFMDKIMPVWRKALGTEGFRPYEDILRGRLRARMEAEKQARVAREREEAQHALEEAASERKDDNGDPFAALRAAAAEADEAVEKRARQRERRERERAERAPEPPQAEEEPTLTPVAEKPPSTHRERKPPSTHQEAKPPSTHFERPPSTHFERPPSTRFDRPPSTSFEDGTPSTETLRQRVVAQQESERSAPLDPNETSFLRASTPGFENLDALLQAIDDGTLKLRYSRRQTREILARYAVGTHHISVQFIRSHHGYYALLNYAWIGNETAPGYGAIHSITHEHGFFEATPNLWEKTEAGLLYRFSVTDKSAKLAEKREHHHNKEAAIASLCELHEQLVFMVSEIRREEGRRAR